MKAESILLVRGSPSLALWCLFQVWTMVITLFYHTLQSITKVYKLNGNYLVLLNRDTFVCLFFLFTTYHGTLCNQTVKQYLWGPGMVRAQGTSREGQSPGCRGTSILGPLGKNYFHFSQVLPWKRLKQTCQSTYLQSTPLGVQNKNEKTSLVIFFLSCNIPLGMFPQKQKLSCKHVNQLF